jgi:hypothetical protein
MPIKGLSMQDLFWHYLLKSSFQQLSFFAALEAAAG